MINILLLYMTQVSSQCPGPESMQHPSSEWAGMADIVVCGGRGNQTV